MLQIKSDMRDIARKIFAAGIEKMRLTVFRNALQKGIPETDAAEIANIPHEEISKYKSFAQLMEEYYGMPIEQIEAYVHWDITELDWGTPVGSEISEDDS